MPNVFLYNNYRHYLRDFYLDKKEKHRGYSYRSFNEDAGLRSPVFLKLVTEGERNLTLTSLESVIRGLKLAKKEAQFFRILVQFNQAKSTLERDKYFRQLSYFKEFIAVYELQARQYQFYSAWYHAAILEMSAMPDFKEDPAWIAKKLFPEITSEEAKGSLKLLKELGLVSVGNDRKIFRTNKNITTQAEVVDIAVFQFQHEMLRRAEFALKEIDADQRDVSSVTIALDEAGYAEAKRRIQEFRRELNVLLSAVKKPNGVYQINFQIFPLTKPRKKAMCIK